ncbi:hypothetical protein EZ805_03425 [Salmonella enterica subsp. enterica serovar Typhimurium]|nr:hypothetical protein [Salmonella enterica subsp. enterica serovar Typhimurium]
MPRYCTSANRFTYRRKLTAATAGAVILLPDGGVNALSCLQDCTKCRADKRSAIRQNYQAV